MIKMSRKAKKAMAVALTAGMLASTAATPVMAATKGWKQNTKGWWYENADGTYPANKWEKINGKWYYFDANGYMLSGWKKINANWYYLGAANDGAMKASAWQKDANGLWYYLTDNGAMFGGGWKKINDKWYFFDNTGAMQSGVIKVEGETYYMGGNDQGWMQTGKVNVAGTEYTFGTDGSCTDVAAPAAAKAFDKNGKEIAPEVDVEAVDGITGTITNALADYQAEYGNVLIAGSDAYLKVLVSDKDGKPVANTPVSLRLEYSDSPAATELVEGYFLTKSLDVQNTDANGYATFVIGASDSDVTATSGDYALLNLTATAVATNQTYKTDLAFATVSLGEVNVLNDEKDYLNVSPSQNAVSGKTDATPLTYTIDGKAETEYVSTQQVNEKGTTNNKVQIELKPQLMIPVANTTSVVDKYYQEINKEIKEYSVYGKGEVTSFTVENIPAGLKYATLNFSSVDVSEYTKVVITAINANDDTVVDTFIIEGPHTQKNFGYQIPVQENVPLKINVRVESEGQVDDDQNAGVFVTDVTGLYNTKTGDGCAAITLENSVKWSQVENKYSNAKTFKDVDPRDYLPENLAGTKYDSADNTYSYQVPVFPYTGNAIMTVKDVNKKIVGYFTIPTRNIDADGCYVVGGECEDFQNENDIVPANHQAILVSYDEAFTTKVGTISQTGSLVEVNSEETGITALEAKINLAGFENEINLTNNTVYTSVHWSPIPNKEAAVESKDFYALVGQNITIKAQLVDNNGNKVSQANQPITYIYGDGEIEELGAVGETKATATVFTSTTDANGQATIKLTSGDEQALVDMLHATSKNYNVQLLIGDTAVTNANLRWVKAGLSFKDSVNYDNVQGVYTDTLDGTSEVESNDKLIKDVGSNWIFGYNVVGDTQDDDDVIRYVSSISGLKVDVSKGGAGEIVTTGMDNGTAKITSTKSGATTLTGTLNENSVVAGTDVVFTVMVNGKPQTHTNVGEGVPSINSSLNIPISWGNVGTQIDIVAPKGISMVVPAVGEKVYVKVSDTFGNEITEKDIEVSVTYSDGVNTVKANFDATKLKTDASDAIGTEDSNADGIIDNLKATTDAKNGLVVVTLPQTIGGITPKTATVTAKVGNETTQKTINYKEDATSTVKFAIGDVVYEPQTSSSNPKVRLIFTTPVNKDTLNVDMFTIKKGEYEIPVAKAEVDGSHANEVILTIDNQYANGLTNETDYTVTIKSKTVKGVEYTLCDSYYRTFNEATGYSFNNVSNTNKFTTADSKLDDAREEVEEAVEAVKNGTTPEELTPDQIIAADVALIDGALIGTHTAESINLGSIATNGSTVTVAILQDWDEPFVTINNSNVVSVALAGRNGGFNTTIKVDVAKANGTTVTKAYKITLVGDGSATSYTIEAVPGV